MNSWSRPQTPFSSAQHALQKYPQMAVTPVIKAAAGAALGGALAARQTTESTLPETLASLPPATPIISPKAGTPGRIKIGNVCGQWANPCIAAAMPVLLLLEQAKEGGGVDAVAVRTQLVREIQNFQQRLLMQQTLPDDVRKLAYLLCTYSDFCMTEAGTLQASGPSLLVEFFQDSWGGERCFDDLHHYLQDPAKFSHFIGLYHLILSLGFKGKYRVIERGDVLLMDLLVRINQQLYGADGIPELTCVTPEIVRPRRRRISPLRLLAVGAVVCLLAYGAASVYLHDKSRGIRNAILAWEPPVPRKIDIMETLPQPLPQILSEGWLEVREDPRGWLLLFTSDGAFATGKSTLSAEFVKKRNIERLGEALASWPGDLEVIGHTDAQPFKNSQANSNLRLSQARAETVAAKLREGTLVNSKYNRDIQAIGKGESEPLADNATEEGRRKNRRVDILWKIGERAQRETNTSVSSAPSWFKPAAVAG